MSIHLYSLYLWVLLYEDIDIEKGAEIKMSVAGKDILMLKVAR